MKNEPTRTDPRCASEWQLNDQVIRLREWGTGRVYELPTEPTGEWLVGSAPSCQLRLHDARQWTSRKHASLLKNRSVWTITDLESKNGLWIDGARRPWFHLAPGIEVGIGSLRLIAESRRLTRVRALLARLIGWSDARTRHVDRALRTIRYLETRRAPLVLRGEGDLLPTARTLHRLVFGNDAPFVVNDPYRSASALEAQPVQNIVDVAQAARAAEGGTLCVRAERSASALAEVTAAIEKRGERAALVLCGQYATRIESNFGSTLVLTPLSQRGNELARVVWEYAADALEALQAESGAFSEQDAELVLRGNPQTLADIEVAVTRLVAIRHYGGVTRAAAHLGVSHVALSRWLSRRR